MILDLRECNGKINAAHFDKFWEELQVFLDEIPLAVDEIRHGDVLQLRELMSV